MCGIAGILDLNGAPVDRAILERMNRELIHRGPDGEGFHIAGPIGLAHRRLSVIDLAGGGQPMTNEDSSIWVTFNGEIYNFRELRDELICHGHDFRTACDTEVLVHAYEQYGHACVTRFRGMFAFALWDTRRQELLLCRDRVGKKPLFYALIRGQFVFASELNALLQHPGISRALDPCAVDDYLTYGYVPGPATGFRGVSKLPPGHHLTVGRGDGVANAPVPVRYWRLEYTPKTPMSESDAVDGLIEVLDESTRLRMVADVPLGVLLSGGVDSSVIVALMSRQSARPVKTFSIGFDEPEFNELSHARAVAERFHTEHHEFVVQPRAAEVLPDLVRHYGEPFADSSALPSYYVARLTREHVTVALNGDGGDECFAGYERYAASLLADRYQRLPAWLRGGLVQRLARMIPERLPRRSRWRQFKRFVGAASLPCEERYVSWMSYFSPPQKQLLYKSEFRQPLANHDAPAWLGRQLAFWAREGTEPLDRLLGVDVESYLCYDLLVKMDIATMANSLEARSPFLDHKVLEFAARLPVGYKLRGRTLKYLLKKAGERYLPRAILNRRKMGFAVPIAAWLRRDLRPLLEEVLLSPQAAVQELFHTGALRTLVDDHVQGRNDYSQQLWALLWLGLWRREFSV